MPYSVNGCGTRFYGDRDRLQDGSYITTEWVTLFFLPLVPIRSFRVWRVGQGTNYIVRSSQSYRTVRISLCWVQVRDVYLIAAPIALAILFFYWAGNREEKSNAANSRVQLESPQPQPTQVDLPLSSADAAAACGTVLKLDKSGFDRLDLFTRLSNLVNASGLTEEDFDNFDSKQKVEEQAFSAYSLAYLTFQKSEPVSHEGLDKMAVHAVQSTDLSKLSASERAEFDTTMTKYKRMMLKSFDLGRNDARTSPCPY